jgi:hypothetical protein
MLDACWGQSIIHTKFIVAGHQKIPRNSYNAVEIQEHKTSIFESLFQCKTVCVSV